MHIDPEQLRACWFLAGPTACGKSEVALILADKLGAEIIALDSMTLYRGMDIGTAKPSSAERARVPHHLFDLLDPDEEYSVAQYVTAASTAVADILNRNRVPLFVGGTGLYLRSLLRGVFEGPPADWGLRRTLALEVEQIGPVPLHQRLKTIDPVTAERVSPNDVRRVIRALEVYELTGMPLSAQQCQPPLTITERPSHVYWISPPRAWLHERINRRVEQMLSGGLIDEVRALLLRSKPLSHTARQALGYKEVIDWLDEGRGDLEQVALTIQTRTRQFAKRQHTWFRNLEECRPLPLTGDETPGEIAERLWTKG